MIKRAAVLVLVALAPFLRADWKEDLKGYLDPPLRDFAGAKAFLIGGRDGLEEQDRQAVDALLAFLARKSGDPRDELDRTVAFFETYGDTEPAFDFLDDALAREFMLFWGNWKRSYPLASAFVLLQRVDDEDLSPPSRIEVGLDLLNDALYRVTGGGAVIAGGLWQRGFHILRLPVGDGYDRTGEIAFDLDLKVPGLIVRKRVRVKVDVQASPVYSLPPVAPAAGKAPPPAARPVEGEVALYIGDKLILKSQRLSSKPSPIKIPIPGPSPWGTKPYIVPRKDSPQFNQVSILDAVNLAIQAIKDIGKRRKAAAAIPPSYRKTQALGFSFTRPVPAGGTVRYSATVSLDAARGTVAADPPPRTL
jgi:hypothetical protein